MAAGIACQNGQAFQDVGDEYVSFDFGATRERIMGVALGLNWLSLPDRDAVSRRGLAWCGMMLSS